MVIVSLILRLKLLNNKLELKLGKRLPVLKHTLKTSMLKLNMKKGREKRLGINSINKWTIWDYQNKKRNLLNKKFSTKKARIIDSNEQKSMLEITSLRKSSFEVPLEKYGSVGIKKLTKLSLLKKWRSQRWYIKIRLHTLEPNEIS